MGLFILLLIHYLNLPFFLFFTTYIDDISWLYVRKKEILGVTRFRYPKLDTMKNHEPNQESKEGLSNFSSSVR